MYQLATVVRKEWSSFFDKAVREKPVFIKRTRDKALLADVNFISALLDAYKFTCKKYQEADGTITLSLDAMDIIENGKTETEAKHKMAQNILEYAKAYYSEYALCSKSPNRKSHLPYVFKVLLLNDIEKIEKLIQC